MRQTPAVLELDNDFGEHPQTMKEIRGHAGRPVALSDGAAGNLFDGGGAEYNLRHPEFGGIGDGVADDTAALLAAAAKVQQAGGGRIVIPQGRWRILSADWQAAAPSGVLCAFNGLRGVEIVGHGATLVADRDFAPNQTLNLFDFTDCAGIDVYGFDVEGKPYEIVQHRGVVTVNIGTGCTEVYVRTRLSDGLAPFLCVGSANTPRSERSHGFDIDVTTIRCTYGINCQHNGDSVRARVWARGTYRSYFIYGVEDHDAYVNSRDNGSGDVLLRGYSGKGLRSIRIHYVNVDSTDSGPEGPRPDCVMLGPADTTACPFEDIEINLHVRYLGAAGCPASAFVLCKFNNSGGFDMTTRGHTMRNVRISGLIEGEGAPATPAFDTIGDWSGETLEGWHLRDLRLKTPKVSYFDFSGLRGVANITNVQADARIYTMGSPNGRVVFVGSKAERFTFDNTEPNAMDFLACEITGAVLPTFNKTYSNCTYGGVSLSIIGGAGAQQGFYGSVGTGKPTITGSRGGNAAMADLLAKLAAVGLIADETTG